MSNWIKQMLEEKENKPVTSKEISPPVYKILDISEIIIPTCFLLHPPKTVKLEACQAFYESHGYLDRQIVVNKNNMLIDGYVGYIVLRQHKVHSCGVSVYQGD